jgi:hypothetical protein
MKSEKNKIEPLWSSQNFFYIFIMSPVVGIMTAYRLYEQGSIHGNGKELPHYVVALGPTISFIQWTMRNLAARVKRLQHEAGSAT